MREELDMIPVSVLVKDKEDEDWTEDSGPHLGSIEHSDNDVFAIYIVGAELEYFISFRISQFKQLLKEAIDES